EAFLPFAALIAGAVVAIQVGARVVVGAVARTFASKPALLMTGMVAAPVVNTSAARLTNAAGDQIAAVVCMIGQTCQKEDGTEVQPEIIDAPQSGIDLLIKIEKCPDINDRSFKMSTRLPSGQSVTYTVDTEDVDGKARIKRIQEA